MDGWMDVHTINDLHFSSINDSLCNSGSLIYVLVPNMFSSAEQPVEVKVLEGGSKKRWSSAGF